MYRLQLIVNSTSQSSDLVGPLCRTLGHPFAHYQNKHLELVERGSVLHVPVLGDHSTRTPDRKREYALEYIPR